MRNQYVNYHPLRVIAFFCLGLLVVSAKPNNLNKNIDVTAIKFYNENFHLKINCGGEQISYGDEIFETDLYFNGSGKSISNSNASIAGTELDEIYQTGRCSTQDLGEFEYTIPVESGEYEVKLHFAEIFWTKPGQRIFSVQIEDNEELLNFDITAEVGTRTAVIKSFTSIVNDGNLNILFSANVNRPAISAIEVFQKSQSPPPPPSESELLTRINCGGEQIIYGDEIFDTDAYFNGSGKSISNSNASIAGTELDEIYQTGRCSTQDLGEFEYTIPVESGEYEVKLHFAEIYWTRPGQRIFSVQIEGNEELLNFDITAEVGTRTAVIKSFTTIVNDGNLNILFSANVNRPAISVIEVLQNSQSPPPPPSESELLTRINCGGEQIIYGDEIFDTDAYFNGSGKSISNSNASIAGTELDEIYQTGRCSTQDLGEFEYTIPVESGEYEVKLHFAEIYWTKPGQRIFSVQIEDNEELLNFDITAEVGTRTAIIKSFTSIVNDGNLNILFSANVNRPAISAIEIFGGSEIIPPPPPIDCIWQDLSNNAHPHIEGQSAKIDGKLYIAGGYDKNIDISNTTEIYDIENDQWSQGTPMPLGVTHGGMVAVNNDLWIIGGFVGDHPGPATARVQIYNTLTDTWSDGPSLPYARGAGAATFFDNKIHFFGGLLPDRITDTSDHYVLDLNNLADGWTLAAPLPLPRNHLSAAQIDGKIYAIGGQFGHDNGVVYNRIMHEYDPLADIWTRRADLLQDRSHFEMGTIVHNKKILIAGGRGANYSIFNTLTRYDPVTDTWLELCELPEELLTPVIAVEGNRLIMAAGGIRGNHIPSFKTRWVSIQSDTSTALKARLNTKKSEKNSIEIFPNPFTDKFQVILNDKPESFDLFIIDLSGQILKKLEYKNTNSITVNLKIQSGIYVLKIKKKTGEDISRKIVRY